MLDHAPLGRVTDAVDLVARGAEVAGADRADLAGLARSGVQVASAIRAGVLFFGLPGGVSPWALRSAAFGAEGGATLAGT